MSCKSAIYCANTTDSVITVGSSIPFGSIIRRFGSNINLNGDSINIQGNGYYKVNISLTASATAVGTVTATLYKDGVAITGATASATASAIADDVNLNIDALVRLMCCSSSSVLTVVLTGTESDLVNMATVVEKI